MPAAAPGVIRADSAPTSFAIARPDASSSSGMLA
jgi:hypothetical protein